MLYDGIRWYMKVYEGLQAPGGISSVLTCFATPETRVSATAQTDGIPSSSIFSTFARWVSDNPVGGMTKLWHHYCFGEAFAGVMVNVCNTLLKELDACEAQSAMKLGNSI